MLKLKFYTDLLLLADLKEKCSLYMLISSWSGEKYKEKIKITYNLQLRNNH